MFQALSDQQGSPFSSLEGGETQLKEKPETIRDAAEMKALNDIGPTSDDLVTKWTQTADANEQEMSYLGTAKARIEAAERKKQRTLSYLGAMYQGSSGLDPTGELTQGTVLMAQRELAETSQEAAAYALEQEAVDNMISLSLTDPDRAELLVNNEYVGSALDTQRTLLTNQLILDREIQKLAATEEDRNILQIVSDGVLGMIPGRSNWIRGGLDGDKVVKHWYDAVASGNRQAQTADSMWNLSSEEFAKQIPHFLENITKTSSVFGYKNIAGELNILREMSTRTPTQEESAGLAAFDILTTVPITKGAKVVYGLTKVGARKAAVGAVVSELGKETISEGIAHAATPSVFATQTVTNGVPIGLNVANQTNRLSAIHQYVKDTLGTGGTTTRFLSQAELDDAISSATKTLDKETGPYSLIDVSKSVETTVDGSELHHIIAKIGKRDGSFFSSAQQAKSAATKMGYGDSPVKMDDPTQMWFVEVTKPVREAGYLTADVTRSGASSVFSNWTLGNRQLVDEVTYAMGVQSGGLLQKRMKVLGKELKEAFGRVPGKDLRFLDDIMLEGQLDGGGKWYSRSELDAKYSRALNRPISDREFDAYMSYVRINDIEHTIRNSVIYKELHVAGFETVDAVGRRLKLADVNARVSNIAAENAVGNKTYRISEGDRVFNMTDGILYNKLNPLTQADILAAERKGYMLLDLDSPALVDGVSDVRKVLVRKSDLVRKPLKQMQLGYAEGGHRHYLGTHFAKQAGTKFLEDGSNIFTRPSTFIAGTKAEVDLWVNEMNKAISYLKGNPNATAGQLDTLMHGTPIHFDGAEFLRDVNKGDINLDHLIESVEDRALPSAYNTTSSWALGDDTVGIQQSYGQMYKSGKGEAALLDWKGQFASTLAPVKSLNRALMNAAKGSSFSDYKLSTIQRWVENYQKGPTNYLDISPSDARSPEFVFINSKILRDTPAPIRARIEGQRQAIKSVIGWKTDTALDVEQATLELVNQVAGDTPGIRDKLVHEAYNWFKESNPVSFMRGLAFDSKLGMFNPGQLFVQLSSALASFSLRPDLKLWGSAVASFAPARAVALAKDPQALISHLISNGAHTVAGMGDVEFRNYLTSMNKSGILDIGGNHALMGEYGAHVSYGAFSAVDKVREAGRFFFNEAETANLIIAYRLAWDDVLKKMGQSASTSREFQRAVYSKTTDYAFGMQREATAAWQRGVMSIPTQFFAYNARMLEAMFSKTFTRKQRAQLFVGQFALYGSSGVPLGYTISEFLKERTGEAPKPGTIEGILDRGMIDNLLYMASGGEMDVLVGERLGSLSFTEKLAETLGIFGSSPYGKKSAAEVAMGATGSIWTSALKPAAEWIRYTTALDGNPANEMLSHQAALSVAKNVSTLSNWLKFRAVTNYGTYISNTGTTLLSDVPDQTAFGVLMGFQPGQMNDLGAAMAHQKERSKAITEASRVISNYHTRYLNEPDNRQQISEEVNLFMGTLDPDIRKAARRKAGRADTSVFTSVAKDIEKQRQKEEEAN